jgi:hypothetical protein
VEKRSEVCECRGGVCVRESIGDPSMLRLIHRTVSLTHNHTLRMFLVLLFIQLSIDIKTR